MEKILEEIYENLCQMVPSRKDIHQKMRSDLFGPEGVTWDTQVKLVNWIEKFQAPVHDRKTNNWKKTFPQEDVEQFLKDYYDHLEIVFKEVKEAKEKIQRGENIFVSEKVEGVNGVPKNLRTGR